MFWRYLSFVFFLCRLIYHIFVSLTVIGAPCVFLGYWYLSKVLFSRKALGHNERKDALPFPTQHVAKDEAMWSKGSNSMIFSTVDSEVLDLYRHRKYRPLVASAKVSIALDELVQTITSKFIDVWYTGISTDREFPTLVDAHLRYVVHRASDRASKINLLDLFIQRLMPAFLTHFRQYKYAERLIRMMSISDKKELDILFVQRYDHQRLHPAALDVVNEYSHAQKMATKLVRILLPDTELSSVYLQSLLREIVATHIIVPLVNFLSDPQTLNQALDQWMTKEIYNKQLIEAFRQNVDATFQRQQKEKRQEGTPRNSSSSETGATTATAPLSYEEFLLSINELDSLREAYRILAAIQAELRVKERLGNTALPNKERVIHRLWIAQRRCEKRIQFLERRGGNSLSGDFKDLLKDDRGIYFFHEYLTSIKKHIYLEAYLSLLQCQKTKYASKSDAFHAYSKLYSSWQEDVLSSMLTPNTRKIMEQLSRGFSPEWRLSDSQVALSDMYLYLESTLYMTFLTSSYFYQYCEQKFGDDTQVGKYTTTADSARNSEDQQKIDENATDFFSSSSESGDDFLSRGQVFVRIPNYRYDNGAMSEKVVAFCVEMEWQSGELTRGSPKQWSVYRRYNDFCVLNERLNRKDLVFPRKSSFFSSFWGQDDKTPDDQRLELQTWLKGILAHPRMEDHRELYAFLNASTLDYSTRPVEGIVLPRREAPSSSSSSPSSTMSALLGRGSFAESLWKKWTLGDNFMWGLMTEEPLKLETDRFREEEVFLDLVEMLCDWMYDIFDLRDAQQWLRRQTLNLLVNQLFGLQIEKHVSDMFRELQSEDNLSALFQQLLQRIKSFGEGESQPPSAPQVKWIHVQAETKLITVMDDLLGKLVGKESAKKGATRLFEFLQHKTFNKHVIYTWLDECVTAFEKAV